MIRFEATLLRPAAPGKAVSWTFLALPHDASAKLPSRGLTSVQGTINGAAFRAVLEPDGRKSHWLRVDRKLREAAGAQAGDIVKVEMAPSADAHEPRVPKELRTALASEPRARALWADITPVARRDWIHWITSAKRAETRALRIHKACSMLAAGKRRVCCFDRSGFYSKSQRSQGGGLDDCPYPRAEREFRKPGQRSWTSLAEAADRLETSRATP